MLVLNRRPGESVLLEPDVEITVLQAKERAVWLRVSGDGIDPPALLGVSTVTTTEVRLEIGAPLRATIGIDEASVEVAGTGHPSVAAQATLSLAMRPGQLVKVGAGLEVTVAPAEPRAGECSRPFLVLGGSAIGTDLRIAFIRPVGSSVRLGVDAPGRRIYRKELWEALVAANQAALGAVDDLSDLREGERPRVRPRVEEERPRVEEERQRVKVGA